MPASRPARSLLQRAVVLAMPLLAVPLFLPESAQAVLPDVKSFCIRYAGHATSETIVMQQRGCQIGGPPTWSTDNNVHLQWCMSQFGPNPSPQQEVDGEKATQALESNRLAALQQCQAQAPAPPPPQAGGNTLKAVAEVTMYDTFEDGNEDLCYINPGDTFTKLAANGATGKWLHLKGNSGNCAGQTGFVYNDGELQ